MTVRAAIDCGTNSIRLLIVDDTSRLLEKATVTRLGKGVHANRVLDESSVARTLDVLRSYQLDIARHGARLIRVIATSATRDASNGSDFLRRASELLGTRVEVITGEQEATLTFAGALSSPDMSGDWTVVDIGGGSTEIATGDVNGPSTAISLDVGSVRMTELFFETDPPTREQFDKLVQQVSSDVQSQKIATADRLVAVGGTATSLCALNRRLKKFEFAEVHGQQLTSTEVQGLVEDFLRVDANERARRTGLDPGRADVIVAGAGILLALMNTFEISGCRISAMDLLDACV